MVLTLFQQGLDLRPREQRALRGKMGMTIVVVSRTLHSDFHYETYIGISPYRTLAVL